ncbi:MAG: AAA family ATPase [Verrucomicrobiae bacterium]|nr:AAA family ATPase [Verrucomicrobiae bacterium]
MSADGLKKLTIEHLRGSVSPFALPFEKGKKLTVVYGENGTGKSTICDAFEFLGKGKVGSLENRGLGKTNKYWHSVGKKPADVAVILETLDGSSCRATIVKSDVVANPSASRPQVEVLRRSQILALVEAKPGDRYTTISRFIDVSGVEISEAALHQLIRDLKENREVAVARVQENQDAIGQFWESAAKPGTDSLAWADTESKRDPNSSDAEVAALTVLQAAYSRFGDYPSRLKSAKEAVQTAKDAAATAQVKAQKCVQTIAADAGEVMGVLESARAYLHKHPAPTVCPLCESADKVQGLDQRITERLASFSDLQNAQVQTKTTGANVQRAEQQLNMLRENAKKHSEDFETARARFTWSADIMMPATPAPPDIEALEIWLAGSAHLPAEWKKAETDRQDKKQFIGTLKRALKTYTENVQAQKELDILLPKLNRALEIVAEERHLFSDSILAKIAAEVGRIYELVHPGEGLNKISLELDPDKRASLEIGSSFCETDAPPQAYFSDSHLDTLGLCVFLALATLDGPEKTVLVLDDILASVDEPHVDRLIEMLYAEAIKFRHCLITTHYRPWKQKLRWGWLKNDQCQFIELSKWTNQQGMTLIRSIPDVERLRALLAETSPDAQLVCAKAGVILEAVLDFLTQLYESKVPRRPGGLYTLGDLLPSIESKLRNALQVEVQIKDASGGFNYQTKSLTPILNELIRIAQARNVFGCHFNALSFELLDSDALGFGQNVLNLVEILTDPDAGWPRNSKSGKYWANSGETRRLHPLKQPT